MEVAWFVFLIACPVFAAALVWLAVKLWRRCSSRKNKVYGTETSLVSFSPAYSNAEPSVALAICVFEIQPVYGMKRGCSAAKQLGPMRITPATLRPIPGGIAHPRVHRTSDT